MQPRSPCWLALLAYRIHGRLAPLASALGLLALTFVLARCSSAGGTSAEDGGIDRSSGSSSSGGSSSGADAMMGDSDLPVPDDGGPTDGTVPDAENAPDGPHGGTTEAGSDDGSFADAEADTRATDTGVQDTGATDGTPCITWADCPVNQACNPTTHTCGLACDGVTSLCNQGCCSGGTCVVGTSPNAAIGACGYNGENCISCSFYCYPVSGGGSCVANSWDNGQGCPSPGTCAASPSSDYCTERTAADAGSVFSMGAATYGVCDKSGVLECLCGCSAVTDCVAPSTKCVNHQCLP
jgi:hypothetical protein